MTDENLLIIELIREWLRFNQFTSTHSVFMAETGVRLRCNAAVTALR